MVRQPIAAAGPVEEILGCKWNLFLSGFMPYGLGFSRKYISLQPFCFLPNSVLNHQFCFMLSHETIPILFMKFCF